MDKASRTPNARRHALGWLAHPVSVAALLTMAVNDHLLKQAHGTWWTGKLSDVAGLIFFPALVAVTVALVVPRARPARLASGALALTGLGFAWVKATAVGATTASAVLSALVGPSHVWRDPTDLLALPALGIAAWVAGRTQFAAGSARVTGLGDRHRPANVGPVRRAVTVAVLPAAVLASVATSQYVPPLITEVVVVEGTVFVTELDYGSESWRPWTEDAQEAEASIDALEEAVAEPDCLSDNLTCFRPTPERYGVDVSYDGGDTWGKDLALSEPEWLALEARTHMGSPREEQLVTYAVAVAEYEGDEVVLAANGVDGLALRDPNGTWQRLLRDGTREPLDVHGLAQAVPPWDWRLTLNVMLFSWAVAFGVIGVGSRRPLFPPLRRPVGDSRLGDPLTAGIIPPTIANGVLRIATAVGLGFVALFMTGASQMLGDFFGPVPVVFLTPLIVAACAGAWTALGLMFRVRPSDAVLVPVFVAMVATFLAWGSVALSWAVAGSGAVSDALSDYVAIVAAVAAALVALGVGAWTRFPRPSDELLRWGAELRVAPPAPPSEAERN